MVEGFEMRVAGLDLLRLLAVLLVLFRHMPGSESFLTVGGWVGVDLFFVLSGWLVSGLLFREIQNTGRVDPLRFLIRRGWKIYPPFWCFMLFSAWWVPRFHSSHDVSWLAEIFFFQNYVQGAWSHTWSLAVEEHFYLALALGVFLLVRYKAIHSLPWLFLLVATAALAGRYLQTQDGPFRELGWTHLRIDSLLFGALLSYWYHFDPAPFWKRWPKSPIALISAALFLPAFFFSMEENAWIRVLGPVLFYVGAGGLVLTVGQWQTANPLVRWGGGIGAASYSIYLWHMVVADVAAVMQKRTDLPIVVPLYFVGSLIVGVAMAKLIELPALKLRERFHGSAKPNASTGCLTLEMLEQNPKD